MLALPIGNNLFPGIAATGTAAHVRSWAVFPYFWRAKAQLQTKTM